MKIFLGGYINTTNAQNINCKALAHFLNKNDFTVLTMQLHTSSFIKIDGVKTFKCFKPILYSKHLAYLWGILRSDVLYLPKLAVDVPRWVPFLSKLLGRKIFSTLEIPMYEDQHYNRYVNCFNSEEKFIKTFSSLNKFYAITNYLYESARDKRIPISKEVLHLGVDFDFFNSIVSIKKELKNIVFVGTLSQRKNVDDIVELSNHFTDIVFHVVGSGVEEKTLRQKSGDNVIYYGKLTHVELLEVLKISDIHFLPSRSEGFPKVILETASAGIPSIVYSDYGASEWIINGKNGFVVEDLKEVKDVIIKIKSEGLEKVSKASIDLARAFSWKNVVKNWEKIIQNL